MSCLKARPMFRDKPISRRAFSALTLALGVARFARETRAREPPGPFEAILESNVRVRMRDAVQLATDVYRPARQRKAVVGRFPTIMERTPY
ncbi:MAG TPA: hypothetical protein VNU73_00385, partial [Steroidobacteraceae bacterium]|nr:hypothetical protein [Steroidobacteraceae bacterium]